MEKEVVVIIVPIVLEKEGFHHILRERNYEIAVLGKEYVGDKADYFLKADTTNIDAVVSELVKFKEEHKIAMIYSASEFGIEVAAEASAILDIPYASSFAAVKRARNKYLTRQFLEKSGVPTPRFFLVKSVEDVVKKSKCMEFPIIIKPLNTSGSCSVVQINNADELEGKVEGVFANRDSMPFYDFMPDTTKEYWIVEEYLEGIEISVESYTFNSETQVIAIHDKYCDVCEPYFIEKTFVTPPPRFTIEQIAEIEDMTKRVLAAIGYDYGVSHVEMKITKSGPRLLEINARIGGGLNIESVFRSTGVNLLEVLLDIRAGKKPDLKINNRKNVAFTLVVAEEGEIVEMTGFEEAEKISGVEIAVPCLKVGDKVKARQAIYGGFILVKDKGIPELLEILDEAERKISIKVESCRDKCNE
ncbi:MAG: ATP-grasp domain-containing protein [Clostridium sp.]